MKKRSSKVRVRIAPSPTGFFHVGSARTALYNWLFARHNKGTFVLRVEDTDVARSSKQMTQVILDGLAWLGLDWDEGPYYQSKRLELYQKYVEKLIKGGHAYFCYCRPEDLEKEKQEAYRNKEDWRYDRRCLHLSPAERAEKEKAHTPKAVRFLIPNHAVVYNDIIHGEIKREAENIEDFIITRHNALPTYNLACVVDDYEMGISHVVRAVDHITNTPKQILLYEALQLPIPQFAHLPLILGEDKRKLSKRHGAVSLMTYRDMGYLSDAVTNYLALLGWSPGDDREIMNIGELIHQFTLERINPANAIFDMNKLEWLNGQYIYKSTDEELLEQLKPYIIEAGLLKAHQFSEKKGWLLKIAHAVKQRLRVLTDINEVARYFFLDDFAYDKSALEKHLNDKTLKLMKQFLSEMQSIGKFDAPSIEKTLRDFAETHNIKARDIIHPLRVFVTGKDGGPSLFETLELIGKDRCIERIDKILTERAVQ